MEMLRKLKSKNGLVNLTWNDTSSYAIASHKNLETPVYLSGIDPRLFGKGSKFRMTAGRKLSDFANSMERISPYVDKNVFGAVKDINIGQLPTNMLGSYSTERGSQGQIVQDTSQIPLVKKYAGNKIFADLVHDGVLLHELAHAHDENVANEGYDIAEGKANDIMRRLLIDRYNASNSKYERKIIRDVYSNL
jgi:hypothetical protein